MTKTLILTLAATLIAGAASMTSAAHAGGGVRLHFNGPLGSFVARPSRGGSYAASSKMCKKDKPSYSRPARSEPSYAAAKSTKRVKKETTVAEYNKPKARTVYRNNKDDVAEDTVESGSTGSTALIQTQTQQDAANNAQPVAATEPAATTTAAVTATATESFGPPAPLTEELKPAAVEETKTAEKDDTCKKFIPAVGVTVSVGC